MYGGKRAFNMSPTYVNVCYKICNAFVESEIAQKIRYAKFYNELKLKKLARSKDSKQCSEIFYIGLII